MKLWTRLALVMALMAVVPIVVTGWFAMGIATHRAADQSREILQRDANGVANFVETWTDGQVQGLSGWMVTFSPGQASPENQRNLLRAVVRAAPSAVSAQLVDTQGLPIADAQFLDAGDAEKIAGHLPGSRERSESLLGRLPIPAALASRDAALASGGVGGSALGEPYLALASNVPSVPVAVVGPYDDTVLAVELSLLKVDAVLGAETTDEHGVALLSSTGSPILGGGHPLVDAQLLEPLLSATDASTTFSYTLPNGQGVFGALAIVPSTKWWVVVVEPAEVVGRPSREIRGLTIEVIVVSSLLALAIGAIFARTLSSPVLALRDGALGIGRGELQRRVEDDRDDELGDLARAFNEMASHLQRNAAEIARQRGEIEQWNRELQARVDERTRELREAQNRLVQSGQLAAIAEVGAGMAHELNNPLAGILGLAQLLKARAKGSADEGLLARIEESAARCRDVVAAMLRFSAGEVDPADTVVVDLRPVLKDVIGLVGGPFRQRGIDLALHEPEEALDVRVHPATGSRILAQILHSMRAGLPEGSRLVLRARTTPKEVVVELEPDRPVAVGGARDDFLASGMGLWVARRALDQIGGRVEEPGDGRLTWNVVLPRAGQGA